MSNRTFLWALAGLVLLFSVGCACYHLGRQSVEGVKVSADTLVREELPQTDTQPSSAPEAPKTEVLNINKATKEQLIELPGIGEVIAQRIVDYRQEIGAFVSVEELLNVSGIGDKKLEAMKDYITVSGS